MADITVKLPNLANQTAIVNALNKIAQQTLDVRSLVSQAVKDNWKTIYPVGSIYVSVNSTSPASLFGGSWEQIKDRFLLACGSTYAAGKTGGEATHKLTVAEIPGHTHHPYVESSKTQSVSTNIFKSSTHGWSSKYEEGIGYMAPAGSSAAHNNMPPFIAVYMWKRVA